MLALNVAEYIDNLSLKLLDRGHLKRDIYILLNKNIIISYVFAEIEEIKL